MSSAGSLSAASALHRRRALLVLPLLTWALRAKASNADSRVLAVVSILPQKQIVERVGGDAVRVEVLVRPGQSPHTYEPTPQQMAALGRAAVFFSIGADFEPALVPKLRRAHPKLRIVDTRQGIALQPMAAHDHHHHGHGQHKHAKGAPDPHIWTSPPLVKQQAATIRDALAELRPEARAQFEASYARYAEELDALDAEVRQMLSGKKERRFMVYHPAWGYFASTYGLEQVPIEIEGKEPGPKTLARIVARARAEGVRVIFVQKQFSRTAAEALARDIGGEVVELDPLAEDFISNTRLVAQALARALR